MTNEMIKFATFDKNYKYSFREDRLRDARNLGYNYISEAIVKIYERTKSARKAGQSVGYMDANSALRILHMIGAKVNNRGGDNKPDSGVKFKELQALGEDVVNSLRITDVANMLGIGRNTVSVYKRRLGWNKGLRPKVYEKAA